VVVGVNDQPVLTSSLFIREQVAGTAVGCNPAVPVLQNCNYSCSVRVVYHGERICERLSSRARLALSIGVSKEPPFSSFCLQVIMANTTFIFVAVHIFLRHVSKRKKSKLRYVRQLSSLGATTRTLFKGVKTLKKRKNTTLTGIYVIAFSSTFVLVHVGLFLVMPERLAPNAWSNVFVLTFNLDSILTDFGMRLVCGTQKKVKESRRQSNFVSPVQSRRGSLDGDGAGERRGSLGEDIGKKFASFTSMMTPLSANINGGNSSIKETDEEGTPPRTQQYQRNINAKPSSSSTKEIDEDAPENQNSPRTNKSKKSASLSFDGLETIDAGIAASIPRTVTRLPKFGQGTGLCKHGRDKFRCAECEVATAQIQNAGPSSSVGAPSNMPVETTGGSSGKAQVFRFEV
jgi:hypothetical protein